MEYRYNAFNQQTTVLMKDGGIQENQYDAEYLRAELSENGKSSRFLYYNGELLAESELDGMAASRYILGYGVAAGWQKEKEGYHSYHLDEQNSTAYIADSDERIENSYQYDAFGIIRSKNEEVCNRILYTGQQYDQVTGQYYLRARYYNPVVGRFLQEDVYRGDGLNLYAYCENNSVVYFDPSGLSSSTLLPNELAYGTYYGLRKKYGGAGKTGLTPHHMASAEYLERRYGVSNGKGLAMLTETTHNNPGGRHGKTNTYGGVSSDYYDLTPRQALARDVSDMRQLLIDQGLYDDYAKQQLRGYIKEQENMTYSTSKKNLNDPDFKGKIIKDEKIFSKEYEDNQEKETNNCKET